MAADTVSITDVAARFRASLAAPGRVTDLLRAPQVDGLEVHDFPAPRRSSDGRTRLGLLLTLRSVLGDLIARPDLTLTGVSHTIHPDVDDAADHDLVHDVVIEQGDLDLEVPPSVALARFGIHASGFGGIDPDPLYAPQVVLVAGHGSGGHLGLFRAHLTAPIHDTDIALPSSDVRDDLEALRQRIWRQYAYTQLRSRMRD
jgi:hypothetical protein